MFPISNYGMKNFYFMFEWCIFPKKRSNQFPAELLNLSANHHFLFDFMSRIFPSFETRCISFDIFYGRIQFRHSVLTKTTLPVFSLLFFLLSFNNATVTFFLPIFTYGLFLSKPLKLTSRVLVEVAVIL